jgi:Putative adhesin
MERTFATTGAVRLAIENNVGLIVITTAETTESTVSLQPDTVAEEELVERATVECRSGGGYDTISVRIPRTHSLNFRRRNGVTVRIGAPFGTDVNIKSGSADIELNGTLGDITVKSGSGDVTVDAATGDVNVATASSDLSIETVRGRLHYYSASGDLRADRIEGGAKVSTANGDIEIGTVFQRLEARNTSGDLRLGEVLGDTSIVAVSGDVRVLSYGAGGMHVRSVSGDVTVGIPTGISFEVDAESVSGEVRSEIPVHDSLGVPGGQPEVSLTVRSVSGDVLVMRAAPALV